MCCSTGPIIRIEDPSFWAWHNVGKPEDQQRKATHHLEKSLPPRRSLSGMPQVKTNPLKQCYSSVPRIRKCHEKNNTTIDEYFLSLSAIVGWLVVSNPSEKYESIGIMRFPIIPIYGKQKNKVPNHQPVGIDTSWESWTANSWACLCVPFAFVDPVLVGACESLIIFFRDAHHNFTIWCVYNCIHIYICVCVYLPKQAKL